MKKRIVSLITVMILLLCLTACGGQTPTETVDTFLNAIKTQDVETIETVYAEDEFDVLQGEDVVETDDEELYAELEKSFMTKVLDYEYTITNEQIKDDKATVDVTFKTYNIGNAVTAWMSEYFTQAITLAFSGASDEQLEALAESIFVSKLDAVTEKNFEKTVTVTLSEVDGVWIIDEFEEDGDFYDAITGGTVEAVENINSIYGE